MWKREREWERQTDAACNVSSSHLFLFYSVMHTCTHYVHTYKQVRVRVRVCDGACLTTPWILSPPLGESMRHSSPFLLAMLFPHIICIFLAYFPGWLAFLLFLFLLLCCHRHSLLLTLLPAAGVNALCVCGCWCGCGCGGCAAVPAAAAAAAAVVKRASGGTWTSSVLVLVVGRQRYVVFIPWLTVWSANLL